MYVASPADTDSFTKDTQDAAAQRTSWPPALLHGLRMTLPTCPILQTDDSRAQREDYRQAASRQSASLSNVSLKEAQATTTPA